MPKRISSKVSSYIKPRQGQNSSLESSQTGEGTVIADMAKGFLQTQAKLDNSQEVVDLLHRINGQLENLQGALNGNSHSGGGYSPPQQEQQPGINQPMPQPQSPQAGQQQAANSQAEVAPELRQLFSMLLANAGQQNNPAAAGGEQGAQQARQSQNQSKEQGNDGNNSSNKPIAVQTAAQVLAQAQYELSNELEASLKKLKQVISESEKIANKISNLLGEENSQ
ncbi:hypothetical protein M7775_16120 [Sporomusa sphaeroides DSM 2875]|uniref:hypothetical protein n=1 Tax=Sporomusa sphaeroides TaxID=47679 RepID=UPI00202E3E72|nr:hypothetical protein [Sporomusa sphaeroides]MCM0760078.1 hypothetical protein [Sporomusa sphaeroides DSM 2875]